MNLYAYCNNDPVNYADPSGHAFETVFDIVSLVASVADVIANPANPWAWAGLLGDVIDVAVPFLTGVGEMTKAVGTTVRVINHTDNVIDAARTFRRTADAADDIRDSVGTYVILYKNANLNYVGKGSYRRAIQSAKGHLADGGEILSIVWAPTSCDRNAFIAEYLMQTVRGVGNSGTLNLIWSPGRNLF